MAYVMLRCVALFAGQCWSRSHVSESQRQFSPPYPRVDFDFWVKYGSWSQCQACGSYHFNDRYFKQFVYQAQGTSAKPDKLAAYRRQVPSDPVEHGPGKVGISSRWWYLPGMYKPAAHCTRCTEPETVDPGGVLLGQLRRRIRSKQPSVDASGEVSRAVPAVSRTQELYRVPRIAEGPRPLSWAKEVVTWPRYEAGAFRLGGRGVSMLELTQEEADALSIIIVNTSVRQEKYGAAHQFNWKKTGITRARFKPGAVNADSMPTPRAVAAFQYLIQHNAWYKRYAALQGERLSQGESLYISSYDLFINFAGVEAAMYPVLYPTTDFTDSGMLAHYQDTFGEDTNR